MDRARIITYASSYAPSDPLPQRVHPMQALPTQHSMTLPQMPRAIDLGERRASEPTLGTWSLDPRRRNVRRLKTKLVCRIHGRFASEKYLFESIGAITRRTRGS